MNTARKVSIKESLQSVIQLPPALVVFNSVFPHRKVENH